MMLGIYAEEKSKVESFLPVRKRLNEEEAPERAGGTSHHCLRHVA